MYIKDKINFAIFRKRRPEIIHKINITTLTLISDMGGVEIRHTFLELKLWLIQCLKTAKLTQTFPI